MKFKFKPSWPLFILGAAAVLYIAAANIFFIGFFNDDAAFLILARSLLPGVSFSAQSYAVPFQDYFLGLPLVLSPFMLLFHPTSPVLRLIPILLTLGSGWFLYQLSRQIFPKAWALILLCVFAFNTMVVRYAGTILSEPLYIFLTIAFLYFLVQKKMSPVWIPSLALAFICVTQPQGILFLGAVFVAGLFEEEKEWFIQMFIMALTIYGLSLFAIYLKTGHAMIQHTIALSSLPSVASVTTYLLRFKATVGLIIPGAFLEWPPVQNLALRSLVAWTGILAVILIIVRGVYCSWEKYYVRMAFFYFAFTLLFLPLWMELTERYALVLIPFVGLLFLTGLLSFKLPPKTPVFLVVFGLLVAAHARGNVLNLRESFKPHQAQKIPLRAFQFIKQKTNPDLRILSTHSPAVQLYTGRQSVRLFSVNEINEFFRLAQFLNVGYVFIQNRDINSPLRGAMYATFPNRIETWVRSYPAFHRIFYDDSEQSEVYEIRMSARRAATLK